MSGSHTIPYTRVDLHGRCRRCFSRVRQDSPKADNSPTASNQSRWRPGPKIENMVSSRVCFSSCDRIISPKHSMYGIFTYIDP